MAPYVQINAPWSGTGSGTCIKVKDEVLVLTAGHVVDGYNQTGEEVYYDDAGEAHRTKSKKCKQPTLIRKSYREAHRHLADVVWFSPVEEDGGNDLALLRPCDQKAFTPARVIEKDDLEVGEDVWYIGTPAGIHARLERSIVAIPDFDLFGRPWTATNGCGYFGSSGGGLYVKRKDHYVLAGVVTRGDASNPKGVLFAKTPTDILAFLDSYIKHKGEKGKSCK